jgi:predicted PurR-regulated permease PerM
MNAWRIALWVFVLIGFLGFLYLVRSILLPFLVAIVIASLLEPAVRKLRLKGFPRPIAVGAILLPFYLAIGLAVTFLVPVLIGEVGSLSNTVDAFTSDLVAAGDRNNFFLRWNPVIEAEQSKGLEAGIDRLLSQNRQNLIRLGLPSTRQQIIQDYIEPKRPEIAGTVKSSFNSLFGVVTGLVGNLFDLVIMLILIPMLMIEFEDFRRTAPRMIPPAFRASAVALLGDVGRVFISYLRGYAQLLLIFAVSASLVLMALNVPNALLLGGLFAALFMIPYIGHWIAIIVLYLAVGLGGINGDFLIHMSSSWVYGVVAVVIYFGFTVVIDNLVFPKLVGKAVGLSAPLSLFVSFSGFALFGLIGMVVALPVAGAIKIILERVLRFTSSAPESLALPAVPLRHRRAAS